jgi:hypothetical protein
VAGRRSGVSDIAHRTVETNGIRMHLAETGAGPLAQVNAELVAFLAGPGHP